MLIPALLTAIMIPSRKLIYPTLGKGKSTFKRGYVWFQPLHFQSSVNLLPSRTDATASTTDLDDGSGSGLVGAPQESSIRHGTGLMFLGHHRHNTTEIYQLTVILGNLHHPLTCSGSRSRFGRFATQSLHQPIAHINLATSKLWKPHLSC